MFLRTLCLLGSAFALLLSTASLRAEPPTDDSVREMLKLSKAEALVDSMFTQLEAMQKQMIEQMTKDAGKEGVNEMAEKMRKRMSETLRQELSWAVLEPLYIEIYREVFTQEEVDGIVQFYRTPAGQSMLAKLPLVLQKSMTGVQTKIQPMLRKMQEAAKEAMEEARKEFEAKRKQPKRS